MESTKQKEQVMLWEGLLLSFLPNTLDLSTPGTSL